MQCKKNILGALVGVGLWALLSTSAVAAELNAYNMPFCKSLVIHKGLSTPLTAGQKADFEWYLNERSKIFTRIWQSELQYGLINKKVLDAQFAVMSERKKFLLSEPQSAPLTVVQRGELEALWTSMESEQNATEKTKIQKQLLTKSVEYGLMSATEAKERALLLKEQLKYQQEQAKHKPEGMAYRERDVQRKVLVTELDEQLRRLNKLYLEKRLQGRNTTYKQRAEIMSELDNYGMTVVKKVAEHSNAVTQNEAADSAAIPPHNEQICF